ncbi:phosphonate C-P lyase system protein PhnH [Neoroseomonas lacus]|uniref:Carbon-phosphorus lyase n=1 Tax=Neoroseomonas lacus TaxID=287609 RepID=A0A917NGH2_9PROT|nr:phosphonate C-P lyase system protein PhnH [Neoroseomonas lacus]GGI99499.1 carbon-phosphorus lyase [Neoroseomonas lacus]
MNGLTPGFADAGLTPGFADPVLDGQATFRAVLEAMSRPGRVQRAGSALRPPAPLNQAAAAVLLTLADADTGFAHDAGVAAEAWLRFHCGMPLVPGAQAAFVLATGTPPALASLAQGSEEEPQAGATLVLQVNALTEGTGWRLIGPGIETEHRLHVDGAPAGFVAAWAVNRASFPLGVDVVLCVGDRLAALPRTTMIAEG